MKLTVPNWTTGGPIIVSLRCPSCKHLGTWESHPADLQVHDMIAPGKSRVLLGGHRRCPNPTCHAHLFVIHEGGRVLVSYPPERFDFDASNIPTGIATTFEEAITCHANDCFVAAAIMVRKTLEQLCDNRGATGKNLKERIQDLKSQVVLPLDLLSGLDDIRLLGNDAAHIESEVYSQIAQEELDVAIELTKEVLKAIFQYSSLRDRLRALKKPATLEGANDG